MNRVSYSQTSVNIPDDDQLLADAERFSLMEDEVNQALAENPADVLAAIAAETHPSEPTPQDFLTPIRQALDTLDTKKLYECLDGLAQLKRLSHVSFMLTKQEIKQKFGSLVNWRDFNSALSHAERQQTLAETGEKPSVADIAHHWAMAHRDTWAYDTASLCWRRWNDEYWEEEEEKASILDQYAVAALQEAGTPVNASNAVNLFQRIAQSHCKRQFMPAPNKINFANGTLDTTTGKLSRYHKEDNLKYCLPYCYNPQKQYPTICKFLLSIIQERCEGQLVPNVYGVQAVMAHIGLALLGDTSLHKALVALGVPGSGKSTLLDLINAACGLLPGNYVPHDVFSREIEGKRSRYIHNKRRIACLDEVPADALQDEETFKSMTAHKGVSMRGMHKDEQIDNQWKPKAFLVANDDPHYKDISGAIKRRLIVLRTPVQRYDEPKDGQPGQNALLLESLLPELEGFVPMCIAYAMEVRRRGFYPQSATMKRDLDEIATSGNYLKSCIEEKFILEPGAHELTSTLHTVYMEYCDSMGKNIPRYASNGFSGALVGMNIGVTQKKLRGQRALVGVRLRADNDPVLDDESTNRKYQDSEILAVDDPTMDDCLDDKDDQWTIKKEDRPLAESTPQADVQESMDDWTMKSGNLYFSETHTHSSDITPIKKYKSDVLPSNRPLAPADTLDKPIHSMDDTQKTTVQTIVQPSKPSSKKGNCEVGTCYRKAIDWDTDGVTPVFAYCQLHKPQLDKARRENAD